MDEQENGVGNTMEHKKNPKSKPIFGSDNPNSINLTANLIDDLLDKLPPDVQIDTIFRIIMRCEYWNKESEESAYKCINVLEKLFGHLRLIEFRKKLMEIYNVLPKEERIDSFEKRYAETAVDIKLYILGKIIHGWNVRYDPVCKQISDTHGTIINVPYFIKGSEECFSFLVNAYNTARRTPCDISSDRPYETAKHGDVRKGIEKLFREYLEECKWPAYVLDQWIIREDVPKEIALVLLKARARIGGLEIGLKELKFLKPFDLFQRSEQAINFVKEYMEKIRLVEEYADKLASRITESFVLDKKIEYTLQSEESATLKVVCPLKNPHYIKEEERQQYLIIIGEIIKMRDILLKDVKFPIKISIDFNGYNFSRKV